MPQFTFTNDQKAQIIGWLNREKDFLLSIVSMSEKIMIPQATGSLEPLRGDLDFVTRLRSSFRGPNPIVDLSPQDIDTLVDIARSNRFEDREEFWKSIITVVEPST